MKTISITVDEARLAEHGAKKGIIPSRLADMIGRHVLGAATGVGQDYSVALDRYGIRFDHSGLEGALTNIVFNATVIPDPEMQGATDCYRVPIDDIRAGADALSKIGLVMPER